MIGGAPASLVQDIIDDVVTNEGAEALVATMRNQRADNSGFRRLYVPYASDQRRSWLS